MRLDHAKANGLWRERLCLAPTAQGGIGLAGQEGEFTSFVSNDYLGLSRHPLVVEAMAAAGAKYGFGSGGSALLGGYSDLARDFEDEAAAWLGRDRAVLLGSGFLANQAVALSFLGLNLAGERSSKRRRWIIDHNCHASILDGVRLSGWPLSRFAHNSLEHLARALDSAEDSETAVFTEALFSMDGDSPDLAALARLLHKRASLIVDEAHSLGICGSGGRGLCHGLAPGSVALLTLPLGKAVGGYGALVCGDSDAVTAVIEFARSYIYSTALPTAVVAGDLAAWRLLPQMDEARQALLGNIAYLRRCLSESGISCHGDARSPIQLIACPDNTRAVAVADYLFGHRLLAGAIRAPTVASPRLRLSLRASHSHSDIDQLIDRLRSPECPGLGARR